MSVHCNASRGDFVVRWRREGPHRTKRFGTERDAVAFEHSLSTAPGDATRESAPSAMKARVAEVDAKLVAGRRVGQGASTRT